MTGMPVYGAEFSDGENVEQVQTESAENSNEENQVEKEDISDVEEVEDEGLENNDVAAADTMSLEDDSAEELNEETGSEDISADINDSFTNEVLPGSAKAEKQVSKLEIVKLPEETTFTFPFEDYFDEDNEEGLVNLYGLTIKITYTDGTTKQLVLDDGVTTDEFGEEFEQDCHFREYEYENGISLDGYNITIEHKDDDYDEDRQILRPGKYAISVVYEENAKISCKYQNAISIEMEDCPSLVKSGEKYSKTVKGDVRDVEFVKFTPDTSGKYILSSRENNSKWGNELDSIFDNRMQKVKVEKCSGMSLCELEKGKTYYLHFVIYSFYTNSTTTIYAEKAAEITSIKPLGNLNPEPLYVSVDIDPYGHVSNKWNVSCCWSGKIKVTYSDGYSESLYLWEANRYGQEFKCYISSKNKPTVGSYNVHIAFSGNKVEGIIKNVPMKKASEMPTINGQGQKTVFVRSVPWSVYVRFKTGSETKYKINLKLPFEYEYLPGYKDMSIESENKKEDYSLNNGDTITLKPNTVYFIRGYLGGLWTEAPNATFIVTPEFTGPLNVKLSKSSFTYNGKNQTPAITVTHKGKTLSSSDYTVKYTNNKNVGTATVTVTGKGSYKNCTGIATFKIVPKPTATPKPVFYTGKFTVKLSSTSYSYNGKSQTPKVTVLYKGKVVSSKYYTVSCKNNKNIGTATVTITGKGNYKKCTGKSTFKISLKKVTVSGLKAGKKSITVNWKTVSGSTGYQIQYSTNKNFSKSKTITISGSGKNSAMIKKLTSKKNYYVRVRAYKTINGKKNYGTYSSAKTVKVK